MDTQHTFEFGHDWISEYFPLWRRLLPLDDITSVLEIGAFEGRATCWFLLNCHNADVTAIDTFEGGHDHKQLGLDFSDVERRFRHNTAPWQDRVALYKNRSFDALVNMHTDGWGRYDVILVDGSHMACDVFTDIALSWPLLAAGGVMILDDYLWGEDRPRHERPLPAIDAFADCFKGQYEILDWNYQCIVRKLPAKL